MKKLKSIFRLKTILLGVLLGALMLFVASGKAKNGKEMEILFLDLYHNRLIAENYVYKLSTHFNQKKIDLINGDLRTNTIQLSVQNDSISNLLMGFSKTMLTEEEGGVFASLLRDVKRAQELESALTNQTGKTPGLTAAYDTIVSELKALAAIQVKEADNLFKEVKRSSSAFSIASELFWALGFTILLLVAGTLKNTNLLPKKERSYLLN